MHDPFACVESIVGRLSFVRILPVCLGLFNHYQDLWYHHFTARARCHPPSRNLPRLVSRTRLLHPLRLPVSSAAAVPAHQLRFGGCVSGHCAKCVWPHLPQCVQRVCELVLLFGLVFSVRLSIQTRTDCVAEAHVGNRHV